MKAWHAAAALLVLCAATFACGREDTLTQEEYALITEGQGVMRVLTVEDSLDLAVLRAPSADFALGDISSDAYVILAQRMLETVTSPEQDGVGIAGPQVGINRRIVAVQRFDKPGEPFEVYPNIRITGLHGPLELGAEGCLSVPGMRGNVLRARHVDIAYVSPRTLKDTVESVHGFTAVIFQHECDHLDGVLYIDKLQ